MKKILLVALLVIALPLYLYNALLLFKVAFPWNTGTGDKKTVMHRHTFEQLLIAAMPAKFEERGRDPFLLTKPKIRMPKKETAPEKPVKKSVEKPKIILTGVMWNPRLPVAMLKLPGGETKMVKEGQQIADGMTVKKIDKRQVVIVSGGQEFTIEKR